MRVQAVTLKRLTSLRKLKQLQGVRLGKNLVKVHTIPGSFYAATKIRPDRTFVYTQKSLWRRDFCDEAKLLRRAAENHIMDAYRCS